MNIWLLVIILTIVPSRSDGKTCPENYYLTGSMCVECSAAMKWCLACTGMGACTECAPGAYLAEGYCKPCDPACERCTGPGACTACSTTHCRASDGTCKDPGSVYTGCSMCAHDTGKCIACAEGYVHSGSGATPCTKCAENCLSCKSPTECTKPSSGYYVNPSTKQPVACSSANCDVCTDAGACTACKSGYRLSTSSSSSTASETCVSCSSNCSVCTADKCVSCVSGYALGSDGTCQACVSGCTICADSENQLPGKCLPNGCAQGHYYHSYTKRCHKCSSNCDACYLDEMYNIPICTRCSESSQSMVGPNIYGLWCSSISTRDCTNKGILLNDVCFPCYGQITGCIVCSNRFYCTECLDGYYLHDNLCVYCDSNCLTCETTATNCTDCDDGFVLQSGKCVKVDLVISNCLQAKNTADPAEGCSACRGGFHLSNGACEKCVDNCQICNGPLLSDCKLGFNGYRYDSSKQTLEKCTVDNCEMCVSSANSCSACKEGFYSSSGGQTCSKGQVANCKVYSSDGSTCSECLANYGVSTDGRRCSPCLAGCKGECTEHTCESGECLQGYYFDSDETCVPCPNGCAACSKDSSGIIICDRCSSGEVFAISSVRSLSCNRSSPNFAQRRAGIISAVAILGIIIIGLMVALPFLVRLAKERGMRLGRMHRTAHGSESHNEFLLEEPELL